MSLYGENEICTICLADNGFIVKMKDVEAEAEAEAERKKQKAGGYIPSAEPEVIVVTTTGALLKLLKEKLPALATAQEEYEDGFEEAAKSPTATSKY